MNWSLCSECLWLEAPWVMMIKLGQCIPQWRNLTSPRSSGGQEAVWMKLEVISPLPLTKTWYTCLAGGETRRISLLVKGMQLISYNICSQFTLFLTIPWGMIEKTLSSLKYVVSIVRVLPRLLSQFLVSLTSYG